MKTLRDCFADIQDEVVGGMPEAGISGISLDSRQVKPHDLFVALTGGSVDGHEFIADAVQRGASAVMGTRALHDLAVPYVQVKDARRSLAWVSAAFHGHPARRMTVIGVTGTDGKTTTCNLIHRILLKAGLRAGMISTVNAVIGDEVLDTGFHVTTPEAPAIQGYLARMADAGLTHVVLETTSHGLAQHRASACEVDVAVVTNITHEHLDYHGSYEAYLAAKARLFEMLRETASKPAGNPRTAVLNRDDRSFETLVRIPCDRQVTYSLEAMADLTADSIRLDGDGIAFSTVSNGSRFPFHSRLIGAYNVANCLAAIGATQMALGISPQAVAEGIASLEGIPGRMERIALGQDFTAIVDFAHTPNALRVTLEALRPITQGRLIAVFGSAGLRDRQKRRLMAETSAKLADITFLTAEDPRTESLEDILKEMAAGAAANGAEEGKTLYRVADRGDAIRQAVRLATQGDVVVACGKGHEQSMCFGETEYPWDDRIAMRAALAELLGLDGPEMPHLPTS